MIGWEISTVDNDGEEEEEGEGGRGRAKYEDSLVGRLLGQAQRVEGEGGGSQGIILSQTKRKHN